jgi:signal transduction histidine kinase
MVSRLIAHEQVSWRQSLGPALFAGLLGLGLHRFAVVPLFDGIDLVLGSVPVLMVALAYGWRAGLVAGAIAGFGTFLTWGHGLSWSAAVVEAMVVGALAQRVYPAMAVLGFWLLLGLPGYWLADRLMPGIFGADLGAVALKAPLQELFAALLAYTLLFLAPLRDTIRRHGGAARLPVVSLVTFQVTFLALSLLTVAGSVMLVSARNLYQYERDTFARYDRTAALSIAARVESLVQGYSNAVSAVSSRPWAPGEEDERRRLTAKLLGPGALQGLVWVDGDFRVRSGWRLDEAGRVVPLPRGYDLSRARPASAPTVQGEVNLEVVPSGRQLREPYLRLVAPAPAGGYVVGLVLLRHLESRLQAATPLSGTDVLVLDAKDALLFRATPSVPGATAVPGAAPDDALVHEAPVGDLGWHVRTVTPEAALRAQVNRALRDALPTVLPVLLLLAALGVSLMGMMGQEFGRLRLAAQRIGRAEPGPSDTFLREFRSMTDTFARVSRSLKQTMQALHTRDAELTLSNSQLGATVDELKALDQNRGEVLNAIGHDIKIPLTAIVGYTELLDDETAGPLNAPQREYVVGIEENSQRVIRLLEDLLDLTRMEVGRFPIDAQPVNVGESLARTQRNLQPLIDRKELAMTVEAAPHLAAVFADPGRLDQVLNNLVSNAIKFTPRGGHLALRAYPAPGGQAAVVQVIDDGAGIPAEHLPHLFERFYRVPGSQAPGTGLGLAISKGLVEAMGGTIGVISEPGQGSTFWFTLPFVGAAPPPAAADAMAGKGTRKGSEPSGPLWGPLGGREGGP